MTLHLGLDIYLTVCTPRADRGAAGKFFLWYQVQNFMNTENESLIDFPCDFPIKVIGKSDSDIDEHVVGILLKYVSTIYEGAVRSRRSKNGNYVALTITMKITSQTQLDQIYQALGASDKVVMIL